MRTLILGISGIDRLAEEWNMKQFIRALISFTLISLAFTGTVLAIQVNIDPAAYTGRWAADYGPDQQGGIVVDLATGSHVVSLGGAELFFNVAVDGTVTVENGISASGGVGTLTFNTTTLKVNPVCYRGNWRVTDEATPNLRGVQLVTLVPGLRFYSLEVGANGGFFFDIEGDGTVTVQNGTAATGGVLEDPEVAEGVGSLKLKNTQRFGCGKIR